MTSSLGLSRLVQGVEFRVMDGQACIRALVLRETLESAFGAEPTPAGWLDASNRHAALLEAAVLSCRLRDGVGRVVVLEPRMLDRLRNALPSQSIGFPLLT